MKKEFGKWLMDISKYVTTAVLLSSVFANLTENIWSVTIALITIIATLLLGLYLIKKGG